MGGLISMFPCSLKKIKRTTFLFTQKGEINEGGNKRIDGLVKH
jgi:hypothetical protein